MRRITLVLLAVALGLSGCGRDADRAAVRQVADRFFAAVDSDEGAQACEQLSPATRAKLESQERKPCRDAIATVDLEGAAVTGVDVYVLSAMVRLANGQAAFLDDGKEGWRISAIGCKSNGKPADRPYSCELEN